MPKIQTFDATGAPSGEMDLPAQVFGIHPQRPVLHRAVIGELANRRVGTHSALTRGDVRGGGRKPWRQKGTGRARAGSRRSPLWTGGGITFGPVPRDHSQSIPRRERQFALRSALSAKTEAGRLVVIESPGGQSKTKAVAALLRAVGAADRPVIVTAAGEAAFARAAANVRGARVMDARRLSVQALLTPGMIVVTKPALTTLAEVLGA
jgi:large subunit ribosomal protein L4